MNDIVEEVTGIEVKETVPDTFLRQATIRVIDVEPDELIERLEQGKIYANENAKRALKIFYSTKIGPITWISNSASVGSY